MNGANTWCELVARGGLGVEGKITAERVEKVFVNVEREALSDRWCRWVSRY